MQQNNREFPEAAVPALAVWREFVEEVHAANPGHDTRPPLSGRGEPVPPRRHGDGYGHSWLMFATLFLPGPDGTPVNHHISAEFEPDGRVKVKAGNHLNDHIEIAHRRERRGDLALVRADLRAAARAIGMLPAEPDAGPVVAAALEWQRLVDDLGAPAEHIRPALQRLDGALTAYRKGGQA